MSLLIQNRQFSLFEQFSNAIQGWDLEFIQLSHSEGTCHLQQLVFENFQFTHAQLPAKFEQRGYIGQGIYTFALMAPASSEIKWRNRGITQRSLIIFLEDSDYHATSLPGFNIFTISLSKNLLEELAITHFHKNLKDFIDTTSTVAHCRPTDIAALRKMFVELNQNISLGNASFQTSLLIKLEISTCLQILTCLDKSTPHCHGTSLNKRQQALNRSLDLIAGSKLSELSISDLVNYSGASVRTLEYAFLDRFSMSPHKYIKALRLHRVHKQLLKSRAQQSLRRIAEKNGFKQPGQFAKDYNAIYGELPSHTLRRR